MALFELPISNYRSGKSGIFEDVGCVEKRMSINQVRGCIVVTSSLRASSPCPTSLAGSRQCPKLHKAMQETSGSKPDNNAISNMVQSFPPKCKRLCSQNDLCGISSEIHALSKSNSENDFCNTDVYCCKEIRIGENAEESLNR